MTDHLALDLNVTELCLNSGSAHNHWSTSRSDPWVYRTKHHVLGYSPKHTNRQNRILSIKDKEKHLKYWNKTILLHYRVNKDKLIETEPIKQILLLLRKFFLVAFKDESFMPPLSKSYMLKSNPQWNGVWKYRILQVICPVTEALLNGLVPQDSRSLASFAMRSFNKQMVLYELKESMPDNKSAGTVTLSFIVPQTGRNKLIVYKSHGCSLSHNFFPN